MIVIRSCIVLETGMKISGVVSSFCALSCSDYFFFKLSLQIVRNEETIRRTIAVNCTYETSSIIPLKIVVLAARTEQLSQSDLLHICRRETLHYRRLFQAFSKVNLRNFFDFWSRLYRTEHRGGMRMTIGSKTNSYEFIGQSQGESQKSKI